MKIFRYLIVLLFLFSWTSCEDFLDKVEEADDPTEEEIYSSIYKFQGVAYTMYHYVASPIFYWGYSGSFDWWDAYCDESWNNMSWTAAYKMSTGDFRSAVENSNQGIFATGEDADPNKANDYTKIWVPTWKGLRIANLVLANAHLVADATEEEIFQMKADAYYFRAYFHFVIMANWGGLPFLDHPFAPDEEMALPRLSYHDLTKHIVSDLDSAAAMLPEVWPSSMTGRISKGAALALKARALLYDASPLMTHIDGVNVPQAVSEAEKQERWETAAQANWDILRMGTKVPGGMGIYELLPGEDYRSIFIRQGSPFNSEFILIKSGIGSGAVMQLYGPPARYGLGSTNSPTQNLVDKFEMNDGLPVSESPLYDPQDPYKNRDPRFYNAILTNGEEWGSENKVKKVLELYKMPEEGREKRDAQTGYMMKKLWEDPDLGERTITVPIYRLAEFYLNYAEAVNEAYGPNGEVPGSGFTAVDAINVIRDRVGMPPVNDMYTGSKELFRERIRNERAVELCFENHRWFDMRRWMTAHTNKVKQIYAMDITTVSTDDQTPLLYTRRLLQSRTFDQKHYWLPLPRRLTFISSTIKQNPGW